MQEIGLDKFVEAVRTCSLAVKIDRPAESFLKEEFKVHEPDQSWWDFEFNEKIQVMRAHFPPCRRSKEPEMFNSISTKLTAEASNG